MSNRRSILLLVLGIILAVVALWTGRSSDVALQVSGREVLDELVASTEIVLERAGASRIHLVKSGHWRLREPFAVSADEQQVLKLLDVFSQTPILDYLAEDEILKLGHTLADFSLERPVLLATFTLPGAVRSISFGIPTPAADGVYATVSGIPGVFVVRSEVLEAVDLPVDGLRRRSLFLGDAESVSAFDIRRGAGGRLEFVRSGEGWRIGSERASEQNVRKFIGALFQADAVSFVWPVGATNEMTEASTALLSGYGLDPESALTVTLKGDDGRDRSISFGKTAGDGQVYALVHNGSSIVTVNSALKDAAEQDVRLFTDSRLFPVEASSVVYFTVSDGEASYALARDEKGGWRLESPVSARADNERVEELLGRILNLAPTDADAQGVAVSLSTNAPALYVSRNRLVDLSGFDGLRSREILRVDPAQVKRLVRIDGKQADRPVSVVYSRDRQAWNIERMEGDGRVDEQGVTTVLSALAPLTALRVERLKVSTTDLDDYGLNAPYLTLAIDLEGAESVRRNLILGGETEGGRFATIGSADAVFVLSDSVVTTLSTLLAH